MFHPAEIRVPVSTGEVAQILRAAVRRGRRVKVIGSGHSFTDIAGTDGSLVRLDAMARLHAVDLDARTVTVGAGMRLDRLSGILAGLGLALANLGDIAVQTVAGAISTGTHGTGLRLGCLATQVVSMELVTGAGEVVWCDEETEPELFRCAQVGLGALGVITRVTLRCVPAFRLHARETAEPLEGVLDTFVDEAEEHDHLEFFWVPGTRRALVKRNNRTELPARPPSRVSYVRDKLLTENLAFGVACRVGRRWPSTASTVARLVGGAAPTRELVDRSDRVFASPRLVRFAEMEYAIPLDSVAEAVEEVGRLCDRLQTPTTFPIEVRCSAPDAIPLSPGYGRTSAHVAVHVYRGTPHDAYFQGVERIMDGCGGRPHWGKLHYQHAGSLACRYPEWDRFLAVRGAADPAGVLANPYLDRVLGPVEPQ
jgi:L-gulono-1,4-lactone dehydrogenase